MDAARLRRVRESIKKEVSDILRGFKDPRLGFVSVVDVDLSRDGRVAKVYVSVLGGSEDKKDTAEALKSGTGFVRTELGRRVKLRHTPEVVFRLDESIERGTRIQQLLGELEQPSAGSGDGAARVPEGGPPDRQGGSPDDGEE